MYFSLGHDLGTAKIEIILPKEYWLLWEGTEEIETSQIEIMVIDLFYILSFIAILD